MIEGFGNEIPEEKFCEAVKYGLTEVRERYNNILLINLSLLLGSAFTRYVNKTTRIK